MKDGCGMKIAPQLATLCALLLASCASPTPTTNRAAKVQAAPMVSSQSSALIACAEKIGLPQTGIYYNWRQQTYRGSYESFEATGTFDWGLSTGLPPITSYSYNCEHKSSGLIANVTLLN